jgi:hypothetical protein
LDVPESKIMVIEKPPGAEPASILDLLDSCPHQSTPQENKVEAFLKACLKFSSQEIKLKSTLLTWWKNNCATYPTLARMARAYLGCSGSSCAVERLFSAASDVCRSRQGGLLPSTMSHCVISLMWLREGITLSGDFKAAGQVLSSLGKINK